MTEVDEQERHQLWVTPRWWLPNMISQFVSDSRPASGSRISAAGNQMSHDLHNPPRRPHRRRLQHARPVSRSA